MDYQLSFWDDPQIIVPTKKKKKTALPAWVDKAIVANFLLLGAGVQSSTIVEMVVEGELPKPDGVIFADTGNEPSWVYKQVGYLKTRLKSVGVPLVMVENGHIIHDLLALKRIASMPLYTLNAKSGKKGILRRQCTNEYKIVPADNYLRDWLIANNYGKCNIKGARRINRNVAVRLWYGISTDEEFRKTSGTAWKLNYYPLIEKQMSRVDCVEWLHAHNLPVPKKSSCIVCPYHGDDYWLMLFAESPLEFEIACQFDDSLRDPHSDYFFKRANDIVYLHKSCKPLREIDFVALQDKKQREALQLELVVSRPCGFDGGFSCST